MATIDLDKFIADIMGYYEAKCQSLPSRFVQALENQGLEYKDGQIIKIGAIIPKFKAGDVVAPTCNPLLHIKIHHITGEFYCGECGERLFTFAAQDDYILVNDMQDRNAPETSHTPKFKVGDWVVYDLSDDRKAVRQIVDVTDKHYILDGEATNIFYFEDVEDSYHLWTIQDGRKGDVLASKSSVFIFSGNMDKKFGGPCAVCGYTESGNFAPNPEPDRWWCDHIGVTPATQEQRALLESKMQEAGYLWDSNKMELRKIEKPDTIKFTEGEELTEFEDAVWNIINSQVSTGKTLKLEDTPTIVKLLMSVARKQIVKEIDWFKLCREFKASGGPHVEIYRKGIDDVLKEIKEG